VHGGDTSAQLPPGSDAPRVARTLVRQTWPDEHPDVVDVALLCVSELVTNAVVHATGPYTLHLRSTPGGRLRIEVDDSDGRSPVVREVMADQAGGRGMLLVDRLAADWGTSHRPGGKTVWAELRAS
jgi:anti-sigma regulatory factor (Ser/Thr protein kinase)